MTIATRFHDWQRGAPPGGPYGACSPNLRAVLAHLEEASPWLTDLGCFAARPVRGSSSVPSSHSFGAALDIGYPADKRHDVLNPLLLDLIGNSLEYGIDAIHDYVGCRIWRAGRTSDVGDACSRWWKAQRRSSASGMGQAWATHLHIETPPWAWHDGSAVGSRAD